MTGGQPAHAPLAALPVLVLDLETTGLDVRQDRVVQIGAVAMQGATILDTPRIDQHIAPGIAISPRATRIHGIDDARVAGAPGFADVAAALRAAMDGRVVVGHHVGFDLAVLRHEAARAGIPWHDPVALDVAMLVGALDPALPDLGLETIAAGLGVVVKGRHSAMGDCLATAGIFARLLAPLRDAQVRTLGEARAFAATRGDLALVRAEASWATDTPAPAPEAAPAMDLYAFERQVCDLMRAPPLFIGAHASLRAAARAMIEHHVGALLVGTPDAPPTGIVTERDLVRASARPGADADTTSVATIMSAPVATLEERELLYRALGRMDSLGVRHLCITRGSGLAAGMVSQRDLLQHRGRAAASLDDAVSRAGTLVELAAAHGRLPRMAAALVAEGLSGDKVARVVSSELRALTARAARLAEAGLQAAGRGDAPAPWCLLVLGSGGRGESLLGADQDNALIHAGGASDDPWFAALGEQVAETLDVAGVPRCRGGVMAANPGWRGTAGQWRERIGDWLRRGKPGDLLNVDIFFDLAPVTGTAALARDLHTDAVRAAAAAPAFMGLLAESVLAVAPRFSLFGRLHLTEGRADLKRDGLLPLVSLARTLALHAGSTARATSERLGDAAAAGCLPDGDARALVALHAELLGLVVRQQVADLAAGIPPSSRVALTALDRTTHAHLNRGLHRLSAVLQEIRGAVAGRAGP